MEINAIDCSERSKTTSTECLNERLEMFSVIDGGFLKEGLLCPDCKIECKTITELMEHFSTQHQNDRKNSSKINQALFSPSSSSNKQLTTTFKTIFNKIIKPSAVNQFRSISSLDLFNKIDSDDQNVILKWQDSVQLGF